MKRSLLTALLTPALLALSAGTALAQTGYTITGAMSNFDCTNHCDSDTDEIEIEIEGIQPGDVIHTYTNGNYGSPTVTLSPDGQSTIVDYRNPHHTTAVNSIEHFGVTLRGAYYYGPPATYHPTHVRWYHNGSPATVNGVVPNPNGGAGSPATQPMLPSIAVATTPGSHGQGGVTLMVTNNDPTQIIWVQRRAQITSAPVSLEDLMPNNPVVTTAVQIDPAPVMLLPLQSLTLNRDFIEIEEDQNAVFTALYFQNLPNSDPFSPNVPGAELGNVMTAANASPQPEGCEHSVPTINTQPAEVTQDANTRVDLRVQGRGDDVSPLTYIWSKDGTPITNGGEFSGADSNHLRIQHLTAATEGFYSVQITNTCASIFSRSALVFITGHNVAPIHNPAPACDTIDFNHDSSLFDPQDIDAFLSVYSEGPCIPAGAACGDIDFNNDSSTFDPCDIDSFLLVFSEGPCTACGN